MTTDIKTRHFRSVRTLPKIDRSLFALATVELQIHWYKYVVCSVTAWKTGDQGQNTCSRRSPSHLRKLQRNPDIILPLERSVVSIRIFSLEYAPDECIWSISQKHASGLVGASRGKQRWASSFGTDTQHCPSYHTPECAEQSRQLTR